MKYLLDSNCIAAAVKGRLPMAIRLSSLKPCDVAISAIGRMEVEAGLRGNPRATTRYGKLLHEFLDAVRVLDFGASEAQQAVTVGNYL
ncbi:MAG TPA: type II toxin-antitoxin system VapC family toxin, partial [Nevskiaceae bacterium]|nr:type II toxin-antitoxin system VapC family toxin [Nevskiaceae bacterium]